MKNIRFTLQEGNEYKFTVEELKFILATSEKLLKTSFESSNTIVTRSAIVLSAFLTIFSASGAYVANQINNSSIDIPLLYTAIVLCFYILYLFPRTIKNIVGYGYKAIGSLPKDYLHDYYAGLESNSKEDDPEHYKFRERKMLIAEIDSFQTRIDENQAINKERWNTYKVTMTHVKFMPFVITAFYLIALIISQIIIGC